MSFSACGLAMPPTGHTHRKRGACGCSPWPRAEWSAGGRWEGDLPAWRGQQWGGCWKDPNGGWGVGEGRDWRKAG